MSSSGPLEQVTLAGVGVVSLWAWQLVWDLTEDGWVLDCNGEEILIGRVNNRLPSKPLTEDDVHGLRIWKADVLRIIGFTGTIQ